MIRPVLISSETATSSLRRTWVNSKKCHLVYLLTQQGNRLRQPHESLSLSFMAASVLEHPMCVHMQVQREGLSLYLVLLYDYNDGGEGQLPTVWTFQGIDYPTSTIISVSTQTVTYPACPYYQFVIPTMNEKLKGGKTIRMCNITSLNFRGYNFRPPKMGKSKLKRLCSPRD